MNKFHMQIDHLNTFIEKNVYLTTLKNTFKAIMPLILLSSVITLVNILLSNLEFLKVVFSQTLFSTLNSIVTGIMDNLALFVAFICGFYMGKMRKMDSIRCGIISLTCFLTIYFQSISFLKSGIQPIQKFDSEYLFFSLLISILSVELFRLVLKRTVFKNKYLPEELTSFPAFLFVVIIFILVNYMVFLFSNRTILELVNIIIRTPIDYFFQTAYGIVFAVLFSQLLWFFGIHGGQIISPIRNPVFLINIAANISNYNSGEQPDQVLTFAFWRCFVTAGGIGYLVSLSIIYLLFSKSKKINPL